jgi:hypothetical protein
MNKFSIFADTEPLLIIAVSIITAIAALFHVKEIKNIFTGTADKIIYIVRHYQKVIISIITIIISAGLYSGFTYSFQMSQVSGIIIILIALFCLTSIFFVNFKIGFLFLLTNLILVSFNLILIDYLYIPIDQIIYFTVLCSIWLMSGYVLYFIRLHDKHIKALRKPAESLEATIKNGLEPMISVTVILGVSLVCLSFWNYFPLGIFGLLSGLNLLFIIISIFLVIPILFPAVQLVTLREILQLKLSSRVFSKSMALANLSGWQVKILILTSKINELAPGKELVKKGEFGETMYLFIEGSCKVLFSQNGENEEVLELVGTGDILNETLLLIPGPRPATVKTAERTRYVEIDQISLANLKKIFPKISSQFYLNISKILGNRLADTYKYLNDVQ